MSLILNGTEVKEITFNGAKVDKLNYGGVEVYSSLPAPGKPLNDYTWEEISQIAQAGVGEDYFNVGDCKEITLNGKIGDFLTTSNLKLCLFILDFNHVDNGVADNNIIFGGFKTALTGGVDVALVDSSYNSSPTSGTKAFNMNHWWNNSYYGSNFGGWKGSDLRYDILGATSTSPSQYGRIKNTSNVGYDATAATLTNPKADTLLSALPSDLRGVIRLWDRYVDAVGNASNEDANIKKTVDAITLLAPYEIFGSQSGANQYEKNHQKQMRYYANGNSRVKYSHNKTSTAAWWWECSPRYSLARAFCCVNDDGSAGGGIASCAGAVAPAFKV